MSLFSIFFLKSLKIYRCTKTSDTVNSYKCSVKSVLFALKKKQLESKIVEDDPLCVIL